MRVAFPRALPVTVVLALIGCTDPMGSDPGSAARDRFATVEWNGSQPMLFLQNADGSGRTRVSFDSVTDNIPGNIGPGVSDSTLLTIKRVRWSPDGRYLAVVATPAHEADQVVLVSAEGRALRTVSPNTQVIWSDIEWSPDSHRIAYLMATHMLGGLPDLFITDLTDDRIIRVTTSGLQPPGYTAFRFSRTGTRLYFMKHLGWAPDSVNYLSQSGYVELANGSIVEGVEIVGEPQGISQEGNLLFGIRWSKALPGQRELFVRSLPSGATKVLVSGDLGHAILLDGEREVLLGLWNSDQSALVFRVYGVDSGNDVHATVPTAPSTTWAALGRAAP